MNEEERLAILEQIPRLLDECKNYDDKTDDEIDAVYSEAGNALRVWLQAADKESVVSDVVRFGSFEKSDVEIDSDGDIVVPGGPFTDEDLVEFALFRLERAGQL